VTQLDTAESILDSRNNPSQVLAAPLATIEPSEASRSAQADAIVDRPARASRRHALGP
jgi:hypothetical protein